MMPSTDFPSEQQQTFASANNGATLMGNQQQMQLQQFQQPLYSTVLNVDTGSTRTYPSIGNPLMVPRQQLHSYQQPSYDYQQIRQTHSSGAGPAGGSSWTSQSWMYNGPYYASQMPPLTPASHFHPVERSVVDNTGVNNSPPGGHLLSHQLALLGSSSTPTGSNYTNPSPISLSPPSSNKSTSSNMTSTPPTQQQPAIKGEPTAMEIDGDATPTPKPAGEPSGPSPASADNRKRRVPVPDALKDERYRERRRKNNLSAKKSRDTHRTYMESIKEQLARLVEENAEILRKQKSKRLLVKSLCKKHHQLTGKYPWEDFTVGGIHFEHIMPVLDFVDTEQDDNSSV